jgi:hypothetical protein
MWWKVCNVHSIFDIYKLYRIAAKYKYVIAGKSCVLARKKLYRMNVLLIIHS